MKYIDRYTKPTGFRANKTFNKTLAKPETVIGFKKDLRLLTALITGFKPYSQL